MKELSIKEKAKAYDEALETARKINNGEVVAAPPDWTVCEVIFPELKESEDEKIRKEIMEYVKNTPAAPEGHIEQQVLSRWIAWLEKQAEVESDMDDIEAEEKDIRKAFNKIWDEKQGEQKSADKVEPKFKVGDWVIFDDNHNSVWQVEKIQDFRYYLRHHTGSSMSVHFDNQFIRHWTVEDAKDGDVLVCESGWTCIFKTLVNDETFSSYCFMDKTKWFCDTGSECHTLDERFVKAYIGKISPATKEQRDTLEKAMADAGYTFDFKKKELKKIGQNIEMVEALRTEYEKGRADVIAEKQKPWSEEDEKMIGRIRNIIEAYAFSQSAVDVNGDLCEKKFIDADNWLKSLKHQNTWKPSKEQIEALHDLNLTGDISYMGQARLLIELYNDLKKLTE